MIKVHGGIRHLENGQYQFSIIGFVHGGIRHLEIASSQSAA